MGISACATARLKLTQRVSGLAQNAMEEGVGAVKTGYLTSFTSRERHIGGLGMSMGLDAVAHYPEVALDYLLSKITGSERSTSAINPLTAAKPIAQAGWRGVKDAVAAIRSGIDPATVPTGFDLQKASAGNGILATAQRYVGTIVSASNKPFFEAAQTASLIKRAQMLADREGLIGGEKRARVAQLLAKPTDDMALGSLADAANATLSDDNVVAAGVTGVKQALRTGMKQDVNAPISLSDRAKAQAVTEGYRGDAVHDRVEQLLRNPDQITVSGQPSATTRAARTGQKALSGLAYGASELIAPFPKIESNIAGRVIDYSPAGVAKMLVQASLASKDMRSAIIARGLARAGVGTAAGFTMGYWLAKNGLISSPDAKGDGQQPMALKLGNDYYDLKTFAPFSLLPILGASYYFDNQKRPNERAMNVVRATGRELGAGLEHSVLNGVAQANDAVHGTSDAVRKVIGNMNPTPSIVRQVAKGTDVARDARDDNPLRGALKDAANALPIVRQQTLPTKLDPLGRVIPHPGGLLDALFQPSYHTRVPETSADSLLVRAGLVPKPATNVQALGQRVALPVETQRGLVKEFGTIVEPILTDLSRDPSFAALPIEQQRKVIAARVSEIHRSQTGRLRDSIANAIYNQK